MQKILYIIIMIERNIAYIEEKNQIAVFLPDDLYTEFLSLDITPENQTKILTEIFIKFNESIVKLL